jgi:predicted lipid-binding transport protein (Tim44 family)
MKIWTAVLAGTLVMAAVDAEAGRRLGGGRSVGQQSGNVTQREAAPRPPQQQPQQGVQQGAPAQQQAAPAQRPGAPAAGTQAPRRPWGGMLGGLAAGLGLAWLANALGFGAEFAQFLMFALLALVIMVVVGLVMRARRPAPAAGPGGRPYAFGGAGAAADRASALRQYSPDKVGNDASARPFERNATAGLQIGSGLGGVPEAPAGGSTTWGIPEDFDTAGFVAAAKRNFSTLQDAWDRSDMDTLRAMMTDEMVHEIRTQLAEREAGDSAGGRTEIVMLDAQLLGIEDLGDAYLASVEFSGAVREDLSAGPSPFREVWNMRKSKQGPSGWLVAGVQALQ